MAYCLLQCHSKGLPPFRVSLLSSASVSQPSPSSSSSLPLILQLIGLSDQELQEKMVKDHSYAFNMGNNNIIPFQDIQLVLKTLMERTMPEVLDNRQTEAVCMPETHLPNMPRVVDEQRYEARKGKLDETELQFLRMRVIYSATFSTLL